MKRMLAFALLLGVASLAAFAAPTKDTATVRDNNFHVGGFWTSHKPDQPFASMYGEHGTVWIGVMQSHRSKGFEFAIVAEKDGVRFQIIDEKGDVHSIPVTALLKLEEKPTK